MAAQDGPTSRSGRRLAVAAALGAGLAGLLILLIAVTTSTGDRWGLDRLRSTSATPEAAPTAKPTSNLVAPARKLMNACIKQTKGQDVYDFYQREIPEGAWGDLVRGTVSTFDKPYTLWLSDVDCKPVEAVTVPARGRRTFQAYVGQIWYWAEASVTQPADDCECGVVSPSHSGTDQIFSNTGRLTYYTDQAR